MSSLVAPKCPNCGAPLQLLADRTCVWCHSLVEANTGSGSDPAAGESEIDAQEAKAFDERVRKWTLRPDGPQIDWSSGVASPGTATRRLLDTLRDGVQQPAGRELAADPDLDRELCSVVGRAMALTQTGPVCDVVDALIVSPGVDPGWAAQARDDVKRARKILSEREKFDRPQPAGEQEDPTPPRLAAWVAEKLQAAPKRHHRW